MQAFVPRPQAVPVVAVPRFKLVSALLQTQTHQQPRITQRTVVTPELPIEGRAAKASIEGVHVERR